MKKILFIICVLPLAVCACVKEDTDSPVVEEKMVHISLSTESAPEMFKAVSTRTLLTDDLGVEWQNGDAIALFVKSQAYKLTNVSPDGPAAVFEGEVPESWLAQNFRTVLYPYNATLHNVSTGPVTAREGVGLSKLVIPSDQPLVSGTFARDYNYSVAGLKLSEDKPLYFKNFGGLIAVTLTGNVTVTSLTVTAPENVCGPAYYEMSPKHTGELAYFAKRGFHSEGYWGGNPAPVNTVTLASEDGIALTEISQTFYAFVMPVESAGDYTVTVETKQGKTFTETITNAGGFKSDQILGLGTFDLIYTFADIDGQNLELDPTGQTGKEVILVSDETPDIAGLPLWIDYELADGRIVFTPEINITSSVRTADVTITQGEVSATIRFSQDVAPAVMTVSSFGCDRCAAVSDLFVLEDFFVRAIPDWDVEGNGWLTADKGEGSFTIRVAENTSGKDRTGYVNLTDGRGNVVSTVSVIQTGFGYDGLMGRYTLLFKDKDNKDKGWRLTFTEHPEAENSYAVNALSMDGTDLAPYCPDIRLDYVSQSAGGPMLKLSGPQYFDCSDLYLKAVSAKSDLPADDYGIGFNLVYTGKDGKISFDFIPNAAAGLKYPDGLSGFIFHKGADGTVWEKLNVREGTDCLSITKWGGNHGGFTEK